MGEEASEFETEQRVNPDLGAGWWGGQEDPTLQRYQTLVCSTELSVDGCRVELLGRLRVLAERKRYGRGFGSRCPSAR